MQLYKEDVAYDSSEIDKENISKDKYTNSPGTECLIELIEILFIFSGERPDSRSGFSYIKLLTRLLQSRVVRNVYYTP